MAEANKTGILAKAQKQLSRTKTKVLQTFGKADKSTDETFNDFVQKTEKQQEVAQHLQKEIRNYLHCIRALSQASRSLVTAISQTYEEEWTDAAEVKKSLESVELLWADYQQNVQERVADSLSTYIASFPSLKARIAKRGRKMVDYDNWRHNLTVLQAAKKPDEAKIAKAQEELNDSKRIYEELHTELSTELPDFYNSRITFYADLFQKLFGQESILHCELATLSDTVTTISEKLATEFEHFRYTPRRPLSKSISDNNEDQVLNGDSTPSHPGTASGSAAKHAARKETVSADNFYSNQEEAPSPVRINGSFERKPEGKRTKLSSSQLDSKKKAASRSKGDSSRKPVPVAASLMRTEKHMMNNLPLSPSAGPTSGHAPFAQPIPCQPSMQAEQLPPHPVGSASVLRATSGSTFNLVPASSQMENGNQVVSEPKPMFQPSDHVTYSSGGDDGTFIHASYQEEIEQALCEEMAVSMIPLSSLPPPDLSSMPQGVGANGVMHSMTDEQNKNILKAYKSSSDNSHDNHSPGGRLEGTRPSGSLQNCSNTLHVDEVQAESFPRSVHLLDSDILHSEKSMKDVPYDVLASTVHSSHEVLDLKSVMVPDEKESVSSLVFDIYDNFSFNSQIEQTIGLEQKISYTSFDVLEAEASKGFCNTFVTLSQPEALTVLEDGDFCTQNQNLQSSQQAHETGSKENSLNHSVIIQEKGTLMLEGKNVGASSNKCNALPAQASESSTITAGDDKECVYEILSGDLEGGTECIGQATDNHFKNDLSSDSSDSSDPGEDGACGIKAVLDVYEVVDHKAAVHMRQVQNLTSCEEAPTFICSPASEEESEKPSRNAKGRRSQENYSLPAVTPSSGTITVNKDSRGQWEEGKAANNTDADSRRKQKRQANLKTPGDTGHGEGVLKVMAKDAQKYAIRSTVQLESTSRSAARKTTRKAIKSKKVMTESRVLEDQSPSTQDTQGEPSEHWSTAELDGKSLAPTGFHLSNVDSSSLSAYQSAKVSIRGDNWSHSANTTSCQFPGQPIPSKPPCVSDLGLALESSWGVYGCPVDANRAFDTDQYSFLTLPCTQVTEAQDASQESHFSSLGIKVHMPSSYREHLDSVLDACVVSNRQAAHLTAPQIPHHIGIRSDLTLPQVYVHASFSRIRSISNACLDMNAGDLQVYKSLVFKNTSATEVGREERQEKKLAQSEGTENSEGIQQMENGQGGDGQFVITQMPVGLSAELLAQLVKDPESACDSEATGIGEIRGVPSEQITFQASVRTVDHATCATFDMLPCAAEVHPNCVVVHASKEQPVGTSACVTHAVPDTTHSSESACRSAAVTMCRAREDVAQDPLYVAVTTLEPVTCRAFDALPSVVLGRANCIKAHPCKKHPVCFLNSIFPADSDAVHTIKDLASLSRPAFVDGHGQAGLVVELDMGSMSHCSVGEERSHHIQLAVQTLPYNDGRQNKFLNETPSPAIHDGEGNVLPGHKSDCITAQTQQEGHSVRLERSNSLTTAIASSTIASASEAQEIEFSESMPNRVPPDAGALKTAQKLLDKPFMDFQIGTVADTAIELESHELSDAVKTAEKCSSEYLTDSQVKTSAEAAFESESCNQSDAAKVMPSADASAEREKAETKGTKKIFKSPEFVMLVDGVGGGGDVPMETKDFQCGDGLSIVTMHYNISEQDNKAPQPSQTLVAGDSSLQSMPVAEEPDLLPLMLQRLPSPEKLDGVEVLPLLADSSINNQPSQDFSQSSSLLPPRCENKNGLPLSRDASEREQLQQGSTSNAPVITLDRLSERDLSSAQCTNVPDAETSCVSPLSCSSHDKADCQLPCHLECVTQPLLSEVAMALDRVVPEEEATPGEDAVPSDSAVGSQGGLDSSTFHHQTSSACAEDLSLPRLGQEGVGPAEVRACDSDICSQGGAASNIDAASSNSIEEQAFACHSSSSHSSLGTAAALHASDNFSSSRTLRDTVATLISLQADEASAASDCNVTSDSGQCQDDLHHIGFPSIAMFVQQTVTDAFKRAAASNIMSEEDGRNEEPGTPGMDGDGPEDGTIPTDLQTSALCTVRERSSHLNDEAFPVGDWGQVGETASEYIRERQVTGTGSLLEQEKTCAGSLLGVSEVTAASHTQLQENGTIAIEAEVPGKTRRSPQPKVKRSDDEEEEDEDKHVKSIYEVPGGEEDEDDEAYQDNPSNRPLYQPPLDTLYQVAATYAYHGEDEDELNFEAGDIIYVVPFENEDEQDDGWQMGIRQKDGIRGVFPENFTRRL